MVETTSFLQVNPSKFSWVYISICASNFCAQCFFLKWKTGWWFQPLWKILVSWDYYSQYMEKIKHVPNHQPEKNMMMNPLFFLGTVNHLSRHRAPWTHHSLCACGPWVKMAKKFSPKSQGFHRLEKHGITMKKLRKHTIFSRFLVGAISLWQKWWFLTSKKSDVGNVHSCSQHPEYFF